MIVGINGIPDDVAIKTEIPLDGAPGTADREQGDIDILVCPRNRFESSVAIQVKRIKVAAKALVSGQPNKLPGLVEGVEQANSLARIGFSQIYLHVFVAVDSREQNLGTNAATWEGCSPLMRHQIDTAITRASTRLDARIGLHQWTAIQTSDFAPLVAGSRIAHLWRLARVADQSCDLTKWIAKVFEAEPAGFGHL